MSVAVLGTQPWAGHRLYEQRLAAAVSALTPVAYLEPATSPRSLADLRRGTALADDGRVAVRPAWTVPFTRRLGLEGLRDGAARRAAIAVRTHLGGAPSAMVFTEITAALDVYPGARRVLLVKDDDVAGAPLIGRRPEAVEARLRASIEAADAVVTVSPELRERLRRFGVRAEVIPAGCATGPGRTGPTPGRRPRAALLGGVSPRVLAGHLSAVLDAGLDLVVLGAQHRTFPDAADRVAVERVLADPRVTWHGHVTADRVWEVLADADVGLVPYADTSFNRASFPLKTLEYLAAGLPVVATPLPALDWIGSDQVHVATDAAAFAGTARDVAAAADARVSDACRADAAEHTWERRAAAWAPLLGIVTRRAS
jgi:teichuronic acid biosynthesis glycosyltransferase TuaH